MKMPSMILVSRTAFLITVGSIIVSYFVPSWRGAASFAGATAAFMLLITREVGHKRNAELRNDVVNLQEASKPRAVTEQQADKLRKNLQGFKGTLSVQRQTTGAEIELYWRELSAAITSIGPQFVSIRGGWEKITGLIIIGYEQAKIDEVAAALKSAGIHVDHTALQEEKRPQGYKTYDVDILVGERI